MAPLEKNSSDCSKTHRKMNWKKILTVTKTFCYFEKATVFLFLHFCSSMIIDVIGKREKENPLM